MRSLLLVLLLLPITGFTQTHGEILGQVQSSGNLGVAYASVSIHYGNYLLKTTLADADGVFIFGDLQPGVYTVVASFGDSRSRKEVVWVAGASVTYIDVKLRKPVNSLYRAPGWVNHVEFYLQKRKPQPGLLF